MSSRKRKHRASPTAGGLNDRLLHIQAYEAEVRRGPTLARSLEASGLQTGEALIKHPTGETEIWLDRCVRSIPTLRNQNLVYPMRPGTVTDIHGTFTFGLLRVLLPCFLILLPWGTPTHFQSVRYDVRLILDSLSTFHGPGERRSPSPSGWSDLPSDTEHTFFFCHAEAEEFRRDKRRRLLESAREERLRALEQLEAADEPQEMCWASDEEVCVSETL